MSSMPPLLAPAGVKHGGGASNQQPSRAASGVQARPACGLQIFPVDGYSWTKTLPAGECITSEAFTVGGRSWQIDYFPNGTDASKDSAEFIAVYLRYACSTYQGGYHHSRPNERVRAQFKFSLLDLSGTPAYELPTETGIFTPQSQAAAANLEGCCGNAEFISKEELERRRDSLIKDDCLAIRCDVGVMELQVVAVGPKPRRVHPHSRGYGGGYDHNGGDYDDEEADQRLDEKEFVRRCLTQRRRN